VGARERDETREGREVGIWEEKGGGQGGKELRDEEKSRPTALCTKRRKKRGPREEKVLCSWKLIFDCCDLARR
jgi:hypothetical protein